MATARTQPKTLKDASETLEAMTQKSTETVRDQMQRGMDTWREMSTMTRQNMEALAASAANVTKGMEALNARAAAFSKSSLEQSMEAARALTSVKSVHEAIELQADFARSTFETYVQEVNAVTGLMANLMKDSFRPINERTSAFTNFMHSQR